MLKYIKVYSLKPNTGVQVMNKNISLLLLLKCLAENG